MEDFILYIGKAALALGAFYLAYLALFQHQKHFLFNRLYLPVSFLLSFLIPLITFTKVNYIQPIPVAASNSFAYLPEAAVASEPQFTFEWYHYLLAIYALGIVVCLLNLLVGHLKAMNIIRFSRLKELFGAQVNLTKKDVHPFSFFSRIVLSEKTLKNPDLKMIVDHEMIHVRERHTLDILFAELLFLFQWFNPFAWLTRDAMRNNLEYLTDHQVAQNHNAEAYQLAMVGLAHKKGVAPFLTALNGSQLKNRIIMMKKKTENRYSLLKQMVVLPLLAILVMGLSNKEVRTEVLHDAGQLKVVVDGVELPTDHPDLMKLDFSNGFDGGEVINALGLEDKVVANTLSWDKNPKKDGVYYIQTKDYETGTVPEFDKMVNASVVRVRSDKFTVNGTVENGFGEAIPNAKIVNNESSEEFVADGNGNFELAFNKIEKPVVLSFSAPGYYKNDVVYYGNKKELRINLAESSSEKELTISGKITNNKGEPITGVAVLIEGTTIGTISDFSGDYSLKIAKEDAVLVFNMLGYEFRKVPANKEKINVVLTKSDINSQQSPNGVVVQPKHSVAGKISNKDGDGIPGVMVLVKGTTVGTVSDFSGNYKIETDESNVLVFQMIGYAEKEVAIDGKSELDVQLKSNGTQTPANVVVGYGSPNQLAPRIDLLSNSKNPPLYIVDGKESRKMDILQPDEIASMTVLKSQQAKTLYGDKGKDGVIVITTKAAAKDKTDEVKVIGYGEQKTKNDPLERVRVHISGNSEDPLYIVDGKPIADINSIDPNDIESVSVLKGEQATALYGSVGGKNGVAIVTTKAAAKAKMDDAVILVEGIPYDGDINDIDPKTIESMEVLKGESATERFGPIAKDGAVSIKLKGSTDFGGKSPLIFLDGEKFTGEMNDIDPNNIESISVLKDASAIETYGEDAKDGVILINTKSEEITSELDLRRFIAKRIKYPTKAVEKGSQGTVQAFVEFGKENKVVSIHDYKQKNIEHLEDVVVVGYAKNGVKQPTDDEEMVPELILELKRVVEQLPSVDIKKFKGKAVGVSVKFVLQEK